MIHLVKNGYQRLMKGSFLRGVLVLASGTALGQVVMVLASPILTRVFSPAEFGLLASFTALASVLGVVASWRYEMAVVLPEDEVEAANVVGLSVFVSVWMSALAALIIIPFRGQIAKVIDGGMATSWLPLIPLSLLIAGISQTLNYWSTRQKSYKRLATSRVIQSVVTITTQLMLGLVGVGVPLGLIWGQLLGQVGAAIVLARETWRNESSLLFSSVRPQRAYSVAIEYRKFPQYSVPNGLLNIASQQLPGMLFPAFFGTGELGLFYLAQRMFSIPMSFIGQSFEQVFYQRASEHKLNRAELINLVSKSYRSLGLIVCGPALVLFIVAPSLFGYVFGGDWAVAGVYLRYLLPWMTVRFVVSPSTAMFPILNQQDTSLWYEVVLFISRLSIVLVGALVFRRVDVTLALYSGIGVLANCYLVVKIRRLLREEIGGA